MKTSELIDEKLNWAVAKCEGGIWEPDSVRTAFWLWPGKYPKYSIKAPNYSTDWSQGGPIIERERISVIDIDGYDFWKADKLNKEAIPVINYGPTPLIAAMRCYVASKFGDEIDIPKELLGEQ